MTNSGEISSSNSDGERDIIDRSLARLDEVIITPAQARDVLDYYLALRDGLDLEPDEVVSDDVFALAEIAAMDEPTSFGIVFRKHHVTSAGQPYLAGLRESQLASELSSGSIFSLAQAHRTWRERRQS